MSEAPSTFRAIIDAWPSRRALHTDLSAAGAPPVKPSQIRVWHHRNTIPKAQWAALIKAARWRCIGGVTLTHLRALQRKPKPD